MKWNYTTCNSNSSHSYVYQRLNLKDKLLDKEQRRRCAVTMEHVDVWYEMAERKIVLALIVEDDTIFVPFFKEKLIRMFEYFQSSLSDASPFLSTQKSNSSRCTHTYLLTLCSAQALVDQIHVEKNDFVPSDLMQNDLFRLS